MSHIGLTPTDVYAARGRLAAHLEPTPLRHSEWLSSLLDASLSLKLETIQPTNSFKVRGALNAVLRLAERGQPATIVTASAGNHGRGIALASAKMGVNAVVFAPATAPETKKNAIRQLGATLRDDPPDYDTAELRAREYAQATAGMYISPYNHVDVMAGAGTVALELLDAAPDLDMVVVPIGGGGLASGVALTLKHVAPHVRIIGVEVEASPVFSTSLARGRITTIEVQPSLADGLVGNLEPGSSTFELVRRYVDDIASVGEHTLRDALRGLAREEHLIVEGAGAAATAAVLNRSIGAGRGERIAILVTGANIDAELFGEVLVG